MPGRVLLSVGLVGAAVAVASAANNAPARGGRRNEVVYMANHTKRSNVVLPEPHTYVDTGTIPKDFNWASVNGTNYLTKQLNQHIPQYCGACWAHGAASSLADRIKIARDGKGPDINLAVQYILNCGSEIAGTCEGGTLTGVYEFVQDGDNAWPYDTCLQYEACSYDSTEGKCLQSDWSCNAFNTCRTCSTFTDEGGSCTAVDVFPNASIAEYGEIDGEEKMLAEIYARGPISCVINSDPLVDYNGGIITEPDESTSINHIVALVGWGVSSDNQKYWIGRNSWGEYWGEMGFFRIDRGNNHLGIESSCAWATPGEFTEMNFPCYEDGTNCVSRAAYVDPTASHNQRPQLKYL